MKLTPLAILANILALAVAAPAPEEAGTLACTSNGCACRPGTPQGQYCGWGTAVTRLGRGGSIYDAYECNPSGGCCRYGPRDDCRLASGLMSNAK